MKIIQLQTSNTRPVKQATIVPILRYIQDRIQQTHLRFTRNNAALTDYPGSLA